MNEKLESELARLLFRQAPFVSISLYFLLAIVLYFYWGKLPPSLLLAWSGANLILATALLVLAWRFNFEMGPRDNARWIRSYTILAFFQDITWGLIGPLSFLIDNDVYQMLTLFMLGGMAAGGIATRAVVFSTYVTSVIGLLSPIIIAMAFAGSNISGGMLALTVVFLVFMLSVARNYSRSIRNNILLWLDNEHLIGELVESKKEVEDANSVLVREIDHRLQTEEELVLAKERAEQASAAKNQFLANVSHELRTPLNGILGFNAILKKSELDENNRLYVGQIEKSARTLLNMVNDILDITSIEAGHLKLFERSFSLRDELDDVIAVARTQAANKSLALNYEMAADVPDMLFGDPDRLRQVLHNLVGNAIKYTEQGSVNVRVRGVADSAGVINIGVEVEDSGMGIPESVRPFLFDNFTQGESFEHKKSEGVGLGLAIVKNLLDKMGGKIEFESVEGKGSIFRISLPFRKGTGRGETEAAMVAEDALAGIQQEWSRKRLRVLVVDDNDVNRMVLASFLKQFGVYFEEAASGKTALEKIETGDFDVALLDIQMPDLSGLEVASRIEKMNGRRPSLIAVTAHAFPEQREEILNSGFIDCLIKPISEEDLIRVFNQAGARHESPQ
jgi:signal transduction histidine kinase/CheY-like chemotaxis protein